MLENALAVAVQKGKGEARHANARGTLVFSPTSFEVQHSLFGTIVDSRQRGSEAWLF